MDRFGPGEWITRSTLGSAGSRIVWRVPGKHPSDPQGSPPGGHGSHRDRGKSPDASHGHQSDRGKPADPKSDPHQHEKPIPSQRSDDRHQEPGRHNLWNEKETPHDKPDRLNHWDDKKEITQDPDRPNHWDDKKEPTPAAPTDKPRSKSETKERRRQRARRRKSRSQKQRRVTGPLLLWLQNLTPQAIHQATCFGLLGMLLLLSVLLWYYESWWPATIFLFAPRSLLAIPWLIAVFFTFWLPSWRASVALGIAMIPLWLMAGFNVPSGPGALTDDSAAKLRVMTCNMHSCRIDPPSLEAYIQEQEPQIVVLQNWDAAEKSLLAASQGWHFHQSRAHFLASRFPIVLSQMIGGDSRGEQAAAMRYDLETPVGQVAVFSLHMATNRDGFRRLAHEAEPESIQDNSNRRLRQARYLDTMVKRVKGPAIVMGDFNTPVESPHFRLAWDGLTNAFSQSGWGLGYTFYGDGTMVRIDHILATPHWGVDGCWVGPFVSSPHRPVVADLRWIAPKE